MLVWCWAVALASAQGIEKYFPTTPLDVAAVEQVLTPERLGEAARTYDTAALSAEVDRDRRILAEARGVPLAKLKVSKALDRYAEIVLAMYRLGRPDRVHSWFVAEHVGLPQSPWARGTFAASGETAVIDVVREYVKDLPESSQVAVATEELDGGLVGIVVTIEDAVAFDAFPRVVEPGATVRIPGTVLEGKETYSLSVQREGIEVEEYPLEGEGAFDVEFAAPKAPGIYRVAMTAFEKNRLPEQPFFFSLYVGVEPPVGLTLPDFGSDREMTREAFEAKLGEALTTMRASYDLPPLAVAGNPERLREMIDSVPDNERAAVRFMSRELEKDPLPGESHGLWQSVMGAGFHSAASTAWAWTSHPRSRSYLLDPGYDRVVIGVTSKERSGWLSAAILVAPADDASLRDTARAMLAKRWPDKAGPKPAPELETALDLVAADVAAGKMKTDKALKQFQKIVKTGVLIQGAATSYILVVPPGGSPDLDGMNLPPSMGHLAVGFASGDLGDKRGITYGVLFVIAADEAI
ncbi:MAG: hypothetical protein AAF211_03820 [Myxococcota bacterium]